MRLLIFILFLSIGVITSGQAQDYLDPDSILLKGAKVPQVLLVGSWHFNYPGLDAHQAEEEDRINIFSVRRQEELKELLDYIARFKPTKIAVEGGRNSGYIIRRFERWKSGERQLGASEVDQIAIRLMDRFHLDTLYGVDAWPLLLELRDNRDSTAQEQYTDEILERHYFGGEDPISSSYSEYYAYRNKMSVKHTLLEQFSYINSEKVLNRGFGSYISGGQFDSENFEGPDALSMFWFNRNLRIYRNIQNIDHDENDRILVLFGAAHISILNYLFDCTPLFEHIHFEDLSD